MKPATKLLLFTSAMVVACIIAACIYMLFDKQLTFKHALLQIVKIALIPYVILAVQLYKRQSDPAR